MNILKLRPYGFAPGDTPEVWCAACGRLTTMDPAAFKCRRCATDQCREVERALAELDGTLPANPVPAAWQFDDDMEDEAA